MTASPTAIEDRRRHCLQFHPGAGYWIAPDGAAFPVTTHIAAICDAPEVFGLDAVYLRETFARYREPWASEGDARREIILSVISGSGWIRVRHYRRTGWTVNVPSLDSFVSLRVANFFQEILTAEQEGESVRLDHPNGVLTTEAFALVRRGQQLFEEISQGLT